MISPTSLRKVDVLGSITLLGASVLLSTGLQQAEIEFSWGSAVTLSLILCSIHLIAIFLVVRKQMQLLTDTSIIMTFLVGAVPYVCTVQIPQRFMTVHGLSPFSAATKLLSFGLLVAGRSLVAAALMGKLKIPPCRVILFGAFLQVIGLVLLIRIDDKSKIDRAQYAYQVLTGLGVGFINAALTLSVPYVMDKKGLATRTTATSQFRMLGGLIGLSIAASLSTPQVRAQLLEVLPPENVQHLLEKTEAINSLEGSSLETARGIFSEGYNLQIKMLVGFAVAQVPMTLLMWKNQVSEPGKVRS
ncbi:hypothetical protein GQ44DRAFT_735007 [Phaeosphaeriaceae sp. PMI808]|nr:hypothetical protein GQ44DRAFT_735007 [Phaeosphaeriaceae sp. PMI808]